MSVELRLPVTLPTTLRIAWLCLPYPMSEVEFQTLSGALESFHEELIRQPERETPPCGGVGPGMLSPEGLHDHSTARERATQSGGGT